MCVPDYTSSSWWHELTSHVDVILAAKPKIEFLPRVPGRGNLLGSTLIAIGELGVRGLENAERNGRGVLFYRATPASVIFGHVYVGARLATNR